MKGTEKPDVWWTYDHAPTRKAILISMVVAWLVAVVLLFSDVVKILESRPWWVEFLVALATIAVPIVAVLELRHSAEANRLRGEANDERRKANDLRADALRLQETIGKLEAEKAGHLAQIAANTQRPVTQAQRNADVLRRHIGACVSVTEDYGSRQGSWPSTPLIAEVSEANIVMLFTPSAGSNPQATGIPVDCGDLDVVDIPQGSCPLRLHVRRRYGSSINFGEIRRWEDRNLPVASPVFTRGGTPYHATFSKQGSPETRTLYVYASHDGANSFQLEVSTGERVVADNVEISRRFMLFEVGFRADGFTRSGSGTGGSPHPLFIW
jgi:hypothetical protein